MYRVYMKMIRFGIAFVIVAGVGMFAAVWFFGGAGMRGRPVACCFDQD